ncbi:hypothetical protein [Paenibacillus planticolens]|nr:hypothetical protein [Paenibacillus planticolens]
MSGRNSKPRNNGPAGSPSRLDQFGEKAVQQDKREMKERNKKSTC